MPHRPAEQRTSTVYLPHSCSNAPHDGARNGRCRLSEASSEEVEEAGSPIVIVLPTAERFSAITGYGTHSATAVSYYVCSLPDSGRSRTGSSRSAISAFALTADRWPAGLPARRRGAVAVAFATPACRLETAVALSRRHGPPLDAVDARQEIGDVHFVRFRQQHRNRLRVEIAQDFAEPARERRRKPLEWLVEQK